MNTTSISPTDEQLDIISAVKSTNDNIMVNSYAGTGKTTTLEFIQAASPKKPILCLAFSKDVATEATKRFPSTTTVRTFNSLGHRIWAKSVSKLALDPKKTQLLLKHEIGLLKGDSRRSANESYWEIYNGVALAKSLGYIPDSKFPHATRLISGEAFHAALDEKPSEIVSDLIDTILISSIRAAYEGLIDYNDQIYMPALFGGTFPRFPLVLVDEGQDLNPTNHAMLDKLVKNRVCIVGDPQQSIYAFRGAVQSGMERLKQKYSMSEKTISISFRCPQAIVEAARWRVPGFRWVKEGGKYAILQTHRASDIKEQSAIICRNNAPLFKLAFQLLATKRSVQVAGSEIGPRIIRLLSKLGDAGMSSDTLLGKIKEWKIEKLSTSNSPSTICDTAECMRVFASFGSTLGQAVGYAEHLFAQQGTIKLITGHKSKGREWNTVYHLDPWLLGTEEQELNLRYVIQTRSANEAYEIDSKAIIWQ